MKTTPDDPAQLPGATEEIVLAKGVGPAMSPLVGRQRVVCSRGAPSSLAVLPSKQLQRAGAALLLTEEMNL